MWTLRYAETPEECRDADLLILPGTKNTCSDLQDLRNRGFENILTRERTEFLLGICGGYQMLTQKISDPNKIESNADEMPGLGLISATTIFEKEKQTRRVSGFVFNDCIPVSGYEIHHGRIFQQSIYSPFFSLDNNPREGYCDLQTKIFATTLHGIFDSPQFRRWFLNLIRKGKGWNPLPIQPSADPDLAFRRLARIVRENLDIELLYQILRQGRNHD